MQADAGAAVLPAAVEAAGVFDRAEEGRVVAGVVPGAGERAGPVGALAGGELRAAQGVRWAIG